MGVAGSTSRDRNDPMRYRDAMQYDAMRCVQIGKIGQATHLVEGHLLRYASGFAAASGASLPHRSNRRISTQEAAGLVVPAAITAAVTADLVRCPEGLLVLQGKATEHRDRLRHSRRNVDDNVDVNDNDEDEDEDEDDDDDDDKNTRDDRPPVWQTTSAKHIRHERE